jgi:8-oxo-dGTP diphosphatase
MALKRILNPRTASEAAVVMALLRAHEIPALLHNGHMASLLPGVMIGGYNTQSIMVPEECAADALEMVVNFRTAPSPAGDSSAVRNALELLFFGWFVPAPHNPRRGGKALARFVALHEVAEPDCATVAAPTFAVMLARGANGVVLVFNRYRKVWELPGGLIDPGESARDSAARELAEEAGCVARKLEWLGLVEVSDGLTHYGAVFACEVDEVPASFSSDEIEAIALCRRGSRPRPLGESDAALLNRFG